MWVCSKSIDSWQSYYRNPKLLTQTNKVVKEQFQMSRSSEGPGQNASWLWKGCDLSNTVYEYEINWLTNKKVIRGKRNFNPNC